MITGDHAIRLVPFLLYFNTLSLFLGMRMEEYRLEPVKKSVIVRESLLLNLPVMLFYLGLFFYVYYRSGSTSLGSRFWMIWVPLVAYSIFSRIYRAYRKQDNVEGTFLLTITDDAIAAKQYGLKDIEFSYLEIREIGRRSNGTIIITGGIANRVITIPPAVESREQLVATLNNIMPITEMGRPAKLTDRFRWVYLVLFLCSSIFLATKPLWPLQARCCS